MARNKRLLPEAWRNILLDKFERAPERQAFQDYNCAARAWFEIDRGTTPIGHSIFEIDDLPAFPDPADYPDLEQERDCSRYTSVEDLLNLSILTAQQLSELEDVDLYLLEV